MLNMDFKRELQCSEMLYKRFSKTNRKREKKGQPPLTQNEFAKIIRREYKVWSKKTCYLVEVLGTLLIVATNLRQTFTWVDFVCATVFFFILLGCFHVGLQSQQITSVAVLEILDRCEKRGIDIATYWENL